MSKRRRKKQSYILFEKGEFTPSDALIVASVNCFSRKQKRHFFQDGLYLCTVFAKEMSMNLSGFLRVRGWMVKVKGKGDDKTVCVSYRRLSDCLYVLGEEASMNYLRMSAMFDHLYRVLHNRDTWPKMPYEQSKLLGWWLYCLLVCLFLQYLCFDIGIKETVDRIGEKRKAVDKSREEGGWKKRKGYPDEEDSSNAGDSIDEIMMDDAIEDTDCASENLFREVEEKPMSLPTHGQVQLRQFHMQSSAFSKLLTYQQVLQLGMITLKTCFDPVIPSAYIKDDAFMEQLFCVVFFECSERRMMLEGKFNE